MIYVIGGPTGSGKTSLAIALANAWHAPLINADVFQMYQGMNIGTNKDINAYGKQLPYLFDYLSPSQPTTVAQYQAEIRTLLATLMQDHQKIIIVGGTGLYIKAALYDFTFIHHETPIDLSRFNDLDVKELHAYLLSLDPATALKIHPNNRRRVLRAIAICLQTGQTKSDQEAKQLKQPIYDVKFVGIDLPRATLYARIDARVDEMFAQGLIEEVAFLLTKHPRSSHAFQAIGYKEVIDHLDGKITKEEAISQIKQTTKRYAKRQMTYFRHQFPITWYPSELDAFLGLTA
jgi:tRNA dimethylallyltransferase